MASRSPPPKPLLALLDEERRDLWINMELRMQISCTGSLVTRGPSTDSLAQVPVGLALVRRRWQMG
jgi:hypothetical protein